MWDNRKPEYNPGRDIYAAVKDYYCTDKVQS